MKTKWTFDGQSVLDAQGNNACTKVNGPLIASAPELLEALQMIVRGYELSPLPGMETDIAAARAAIAKATDEPRDFALLIPKEQRDKLRRKLQSRS